MSVPRSANIAIYQGATFILVGTYKDAETGNVIDITGYSARMQIRSSISAATPEIDIDDSGISPASRIEITGASGEIKIIISATDTSGITNASHAKLTMAYDVEIEDGTGVVTRVLEGSAIIHPNVTR